MNVTWISLRTVMAWSIVGVFFYLAVGLAHERETVESTSGRVHFWLTLLHNNGGESQLINAGSGLEDYGGVARSAMLIRQLNRSPQRRPGMARSGAPIANIALESGGGIRNDTIIPVGDITELTTFDCLPLANFVAIVPEVLLFQLKEILENSVSRVEFTDGRFAQIAGLCFVWDPTCTLQVLNAEGNVVTQGTRVREVVLDDSATIVQGRAVVANAPTLNSLSPPSTSSPAVAINIPGHEDRNGMRNHDEIHLWDDYITPGMGANLQDDTSVSGGLTAGSRFVSMGDQKRRPP